MRTLIFILLLGLFLNPAFAQEAAQDISWDGTGGILSYNLSQDCRVKIRAGSARGPVYRTLVNLEERKKGANQEPWDGKDESGLIDFKEFDPLHFCVDALPQSKKDLNLLVSLPKEESKEGALNITQAPLSIALNVNEADQGWFSKDGIEIMAFLDNQLIKLQRAKNLPYSLNLDFKNYSPGRHLLSLNVWSQDHSSVAYKNVIVLLSAEKETLPAKKEDAKPLSGKIAYCQRQKGFWQVWIANLDGSRPRQLTQSPGDKRYPSFSPDGKSVAYGNNKGELFVIGVDGKSNHKVALPVHASCPRWTPDGKRLIFVSYQDLYHGDTEIWEVDLETLKLKKLTNRPWLQYDPCYSPDGTNILFTDGPELYAQDIRQLDLKTGDIIQRTDNQAYDYDMQPVYSADGKRIIFSSNQDGNYDIWIMDKFGRDRLNLTHNPAYDIMPQISADGRWIFFLSDRTGILEVWQMDTQGNNLTQITNSKTDIQDLALYTSLKR